VQVTRVLVESYFDIVRKNLQDAVPKARRGTVVAPRAADNGLPCDSQCHWRALPSCLRKRWSSSAVQPTLPTPYTRGGSCADH